MKKLILISLIAGSLVAAPTASSAAVKSPKPSVKVAGGEEGSAEHEAAEGKKVEKKETGTKKKVIKKKK